MATKTTTAKKATVATPAEAKTHTFIGVMYQYSHIKDTTDRICWFDTLSADKSRTVKFPARLTDDSKYLAGYIKGHTVLEITVKELPPVEGKRRFEIVSMMSENERTNLNALLSYTEKQKA